MRSRVSQAKELRCQRPECGKLFISRKHLVAKFCSRECSAAHQALPDEMARCAWCEKEFTFKVSRSSKKRIFCSVACKREGWALTFRGKPEDKEEWVRCGKCHGLERAGRVHECVMPEMPQGQSAIAGAQLWATDDD